MTLPTPEKTDEIIEGFGEITEVPPLQVELFDFLEEGNPTPRQKELGWLLFTELQSPSDGPEAEPEERQRSVRRLGECLEKVLTKDEAEAVRKHPMSVVEVIEALLERDDLTADEAQILLDAAAALSEVED